MRRLLLPLALLVLTVAVVPRRTMNGPVAVRYPEGTVHGFLELRSVQDRLLASGDLLQVPRDNGVESRLVFQFRDQSRFDETTRFTQQGVFRMQSYHLVQRGPAFASDLDAELDADGRYRVLSTSPKDGRGKRFEGRLELPADVANGLPVVLAKNLRVGDTATVHLVAFMPKPRLVSLQIAYVGADTVMLGARPMPTAHFVVRPRLGVVTAFFARLLGKLPANSHIWVAADRVPTFVRFEGPMYSGPIWHLTLSTPAWPSVAMTR
jgi:hypothetical protein